MVNLHLEMENHTKNLQDLCRICTKKLGRVSYSTTKPAEKGSKVSLIEDCFCCQLTDKTDTHPPRFCNPCYLTMCRMRKARRDGTVYRTSLTLCTWTEHQNGNCNTCKMVEERKFGGRPKVVKNIQACPTHLTDHIQSVSGPRYRCTNPLTPDRFLTGGTVCIDDIVCKSCDNILDEPIELPCTHLLCRLCCFHLLASHPHSFPCPHCEHTHELSVASFRAPAALVDRLLRQLVVRCDREKCKKVVHLCDLKAHLDSKCVLYATTIRQSITLDHILQQPVDAPPTQIEMETAGHIIRKILAQSPAPAFNIPSSHHVSEPFIHPMYAYTSLPTVHPTHQSDQTNCEFR